MRRPYDATYDVSPGYGLTFLKKKICKSADYYKIVEATEVVESSRIVGNLRVTLRRPHENAKLGIVRSSQANHRPNVTLALQDTISKYGNVTHGLLRGQSFYSHV